MAAKHETVGKNGLPLGKFLDDVPKVLYLAAHVMFLGLGVWLWLRASGSGFPFAASLLLYALSQVAFIGYFANLITMKTAVLAEQMMMAAMVVLIVLQAA